MVSNMTLTFGFAGAATKMNGVPSNQHSLPLYRGGQISNDAGNDALTGYYGYSVSALAATPNDFLIGIQTSASYAGVIAFDPAKAENEPAQADKFLEGMPVTICYFGPVWYSSYLKTAAGAIDPVVGCKVITENASGQIQFVAAATATPTGWTEMVARVVEVDLTTNGALLFIGLSNETETSINFASNSTYAVDASIPLRSNVTLTTATPSATRAVQGIVNTYTGGMTAGTVMGVRGEINVRGALSGSFLYGAEGKGIMAAGSSINDGSAYFCGVLGQLDLSLGTTTSGHIACVIASMQDSTGLIGNRTCVNMIYAEAPAYGSGGGVNSMLQGVGSVTTLLDFSGAHAATAVLSVQVAAGSGAVVTSSTALSGVTSEGYLTVLVNGAAKKVYYAA